jgi:SHS2 domain-containing protein
MSVRFLSHTADSGIEATAPTFGALLAELLGGMFGLIASVHPSEAARWVTAHVEAANLEDLVVDTLSELLYHSEVENLLFCTFEVEADPERGVVDVRAGGVPYETVEASGPAIKAVTYHGLVVEERDEWLARVYFDV